MSWRKIKEHSLLPALIFFMLVFTATSVVSSYKVENFDAEVHGEPPMKFWSYEHRWHVVDRLAPESAAEVLGMALLVVLITLGAMEITAKRKEENDEAGGGAG